MEKKQFEEISARLHELTPVMVDEAVALYQKDPVLTDRYRNNLREVAQQAVVSLRDVMLGALQFDHPPILGGQLKWLEGLLEARHLDHQTLRSHLNLIRVHLSQDLPPEHSGPVLAVFDQAVSQINGLH